MQELEQTLDSREVAEMIEKEQPQLVAIATESGKHAQIAVDCMTMGHVNLIIEKPIALSLADADRIIETAKKALYTGHIGDGKIFVYPVEKVVKVRTGEENLAALQDVE